MQKSQNVYVDIGYWFLFLLVLAFAGFYTSYISVIFQPTVPIIHIHFILMTLWMGMLIFQPFLIKYKKLSLHRKLGKLSYVLVPLVLLSGFFMIRFSYYRDISQLKNEASQGLNHLSNDQILQQAAEWKALPFVWLTWFFVFYCLAIINRRKSTVHARFMVATALSLLGPIVDRILFKFEKLGESVRLEAGAFLIADVALALLLWKDYKTNKPTKTLSSALLIYIVGQALYFTIPGTVLWKNFVILIMKPEPW